MPSGTSMHAMICTASPDHREEIYERIQAEKACTTPERKDAGPSSEGSVTQA